MAKRKYGLDENKIAKYIKDGRGQGTGKEYYPWLDIHDFSSSGRVTRCMGWKTGRVQHFMSDNEARYFYLLEWSDAVIDIREQFPILDRERTKEIAREIGMAYPTDSKTKTPIVMTTDFMITAKINGKIIELARTIKPAQDLSMPRVIEKFEIERRYWSEQGIDWGIVTENEINRNFASNVEWVYSAFNLEEINNLTINEMNRLIPYMFEKLNNNASKSLLSILHDMDQDYNFDSGFFLSILRHLIARKRIKVADMKEKINLHKNVNELFNLCISNEASLIKENKGADAV